MKKNYFLRTAAVLLVCALFGLCIVPGTMGRYGTEVSIESATVRAGIFEVAVRKGNDWVSITRGTTGQAVELNLYDTLMQAYEGTPGSPDVHPVGNDADGSLTDAGDLRGYIDDEPEGLIAPGCGGKFKITVMNYSEVSVEVEIEANRIAFSQLLADRGMDKMIQWWDADTNAWVAEFPGLTLADAAVYLEPCGTELSLKTYTFTWRWLFERDYSAAWRTGSAGSPLNAWANNSDTADTNVGRDSADTPVVLPVGLYINVKQVD